MNKQLNIEISFVYFRNMIMNCTRTLHADKHTPNIGGSSEIHRIPIYLFYPILSYPLFTRFIRFSFEAPFYVTGPGPRTPPQNSY